MRELQSPGIVYGKLMDLIARLAELGLVHCDFNEFNVLVRAADAPAGSFLLLAGAANGSIRGIVQRMVKSGGRLSPKVVGDCRQYSQAQP